MRFSFQIDLHYHRAWPRAAGILFLLATGCVGHDQLRLKDPSPCHVQCDYNQVAQLDPECHGYHSTCWKPWAADCPTCPPPPSGVYPVIQEVPSPEQVAPPQPQSKPPQHKLPEPEPKPAPSETKPGPEIPSTPSEPTPAPSETTPKPNETTTPGETTPAPGESMPGPDSKPSDTNQSTTPELPPLVPPGRQIPQGPQQKEHKPPEKKGAQPTSALIEDVLLQSAGCRQAKPLGTITEANEPAKLEPAPTETAQQVCGAPPDNTVPHELAASETAQPLAPGVSASDVQSTPPAEESADNCGVVQAIYQTIEPSAEPSAAAEPSEAVSEESPPTEETADPDAAVRSDAEASADVAPEHSPLLSKLGGVLIVGCSLLCGALYLKKLMGGSGDLETA